MHSTKVNYVFLMYSNQLLKSILDNFSPMVKYLFRYFIACPYILYCLWSTQTDSAATKLHKLLTESKVMVEELEKSNQSTPRQISQQSTPRKNNNENGDKENKVGFILVIVVHRFLGHRVRSFLNLKDLSCFVLPPLHWPV